MTDTKELRRLAQAANAEPDGDVLSWIEGMQRLQGALLPDDVIELLDRLEAVEKERTIDEQRIADLMANLNRVGHENDALRAKVAEMEKQEPVGYMPLATKAALEAGGSGVIWNCRDRGIADEPLYALPGSQNIPEKLCYDSRWEISIDYVDGWNAAVDMMRGKSPSWHCPDCCIAFPFGAPKSCPNDDAKCNSLLAATQGD